jgi:hypothetical protein
MEKNLRNLLIASAVLVGIMVYAFGVIATAQIIFYAGCAAFVTCILNMFLRALKGLRNGRP